MNVHMYFALKLLSAVVYQLLTHWCCSFGILVQYSPVNNGCHYRSTRRKTFKQTPAGVLSDFQMCHYTLSLYAVLHFIFAMYSISCF